MRKKKQQHKNQQIKQNTQTKANDPTNKQTKLLGNLRGSLRRANALDSASLSMHPQNNNKTSQISTKKSEQAEQSSL